MQLGARRAVGVASTSARLVGKLRTPVVHYSPSGLIDNRCLIRRSATSSEADSAQKEEQTKTNDRIQETLADLDALLGIEEEPEEVAETKPEVGDEHVFAHIFPAHQ